jgi:hypothetical protein
MIVICQIAADCFRGGKAAIEAPLDEGLKGAGPCRR